MADQVAEQITALQDKDWGVREDAAVILGQCGDPRGVRPLIEALRDSDRAVREAATTALSSSLSNRSRAKTQPPSEITIPLRSLSMGRLAIVGSSCSAKAP